MRVKQFMLYREAWLCDGNACLSAMNSIIVSRSRLQDVRDLTELTTSKCPPPCACWVRCRTLPHVVSTD